MIALLAWAFCAASTPSITPEDARCMGCHERVSLVRADTLGGGYAVALSEESYGRGSHGSLSCTACHDPGFGSVPHSPGASGAPACRTCHETDPTGCAGTPIPAYETAASGDIHVQRLGPGFTCASCHDPHSASVAPCPDVHESNPLCMTCHGYSTILRTHYWLPSAGLHLRRMGCTACHFPAGGPGTNHQVLPRTASLRDCRACHDREKAGDLFAEESKAWGNRGVPGWRGRLGWELPVMIGAVLLMVAARVRRLAAFPSPLLMGTGPSGAIRTGAIAVLLVSGAAIYFGAGRLLELLSHIHVVAGTLLVAAYAERMLLYATQRRAPPLRYQWIGWAVLVLVIGSGLLLVAPTFTPALDLLVPGIRGVHRGSGAMLGLWVAWSLARRLR